MYWNLNEVMLCAMCIICVAVCCIFVPDLLEKHPNISDIRVFFLLCCRYDDFGNAGVVFALMHNTGSQLLGYSVSE